jgi:cytochrome c peroxidase
MHLRKSFCIISCLTAAIAIFSMSLKEKPANRKAAVLKIAQLYQQEMLRFDSALAAYPAYFVDSSYATRRAKYHHLAYQFKKVECLFTYYHPKLAYETFLLTARFQQRDFGPPLPDNWLWLGPFGIDADSVMLKKSRQDSLFEKKFIERSVKNLRNALKESDYGKEVGSMSESEIFDALRLQMMRISTLGLSNGDMVIEEAGMPALEGEFDAWAAMVAIFAEELSTSEHVLKNELSKTIANGKAVLAQKPGFRNFNRMHFLTDVLMPLSRQLVQLQKALNIESKPSFAAIRATAASVYEKDAFNVDFFAPGEAAYLTKAKAELGKFLFFDPILSDNNERACASCHKPELAFTDGAKKSLNFERGDLPRNAPTVINSAFQKLQFWDLRATSLEDQLDSVINSRDELHSSFENVIDRVNASPEYKQLFYAAFPETKTAGIQRDHVKIAIASYERELSGLNSRFDQYVRGDKTKMSRDEISGFNLYMGKAKCGSCHYAPLFNGVLPPYFDFTDHRSIGVPLKDTMDKYEVDPDMGASKLNQNPFLHFSFKVPTVRNTEVTAPYMHNGVYKTLEQVIDFYDHAGGDKFISDMRPGLKGLPFFMILPEKLNLTAEEKKQVIAFVKSLTDTSASKNIPKRLPKLEGKYASLNNRKVGGVY